MNTNGVVRLLGALALSLATSFVPAAVTRDGLIRHFDEGVPAGAIAQPNRFVPSVRTVHVAVPDAFPLDQVLIARVGGMNPSSGAVVLSRFAEQASPWSSFATVDAAAQGNRFGLRLPEPGPITAVLATLALGIFFFLRRIV